MDRGEVVEDRDPPELDPTICSFPKDPFLSLN